VQKIVLNNFPRQKLQEIVGQRGVSILDDPKMVKGLLYDYCSSSSFQSKATLQREINAILMALDQRIPQDILVASKSRTFELQRNSLKKRLTDLALDEEVAQWAVESWAEALGVSAG
jgi:hypothetical protein